MSNDYARQFVAQAVNKGFLAPAYEHDCVDCGKQAEDYDHRDYNKPLEVEPVCHACNMKRGPGVPFVPVSRNYREKVKQKRIIYFKSEALARASIILGGFDAVINAAGASRRLGMKWAEGKSWPLKHHCRRIEGDTKGAVTCKQLRPDIFGDTAA